MKLRSVVFSTIFLVSLNGCATVFKGYDDTVQIDNVTLPDSLSLVAQNGITIPIDTVKAKVEMGKRIRYILDTTYYQIALHSNTTHIINIKTSKKEYAIARYPKLGAGWFILDMVFGGIPVFVDWYTGAWNHFDPIKVE